MPISETSSQTSKKTSLFRAPSSMFWAGFLIRVLYITIVHTYRIRPEEDHLQFGWEMGRIARALATGFGYADPFTGHSGPTAWSPPLYPLLIAGVFKIFGVYTAASAWVLLTINSVFSAATSSVIYEIAARCFQHTGRGRKIALWSGWLWALYPAAMQFAVRWIWDMCITAFLLSKIIVIALRVRGIGEEASVTGNTSQTRTTTLWAAFGLLSGLVVLLNSTLLLFLPVCGLWMLVGSFKAKAPVLPDTASRLSRLRPHSRLHRTVDRSQLHGLPRFHPDARKPWRGTPSIHPRRTSGLPMGSDDSRLRGMPRLPAVPPDG